MRSGGERRVIFEDAGGGAEGAIKFASSKMGFFAGGIGSGDEILNLSATGAEFGDKKVEISKDAFGLRLERISTTQFDIGTSNPPSGGNLNIKNSNGTDARVVVYSDLFWVRGLGGSNGNGNVKFDGTLDFDDVTLTGIQTSGESFSDDDVSLMTSAAIADYVAANSGMAGVTATASELNILDGATVTTAELNYVDGVTSAIQTQLNTQAALTTAHGTILGATAGTAGASQAVILDSNKDVTGLRNLTLTGNLTVQGTTTTVDTVTMEAANAVVFEGATADDHETTLTIVDPNADRTIKLPNQSGCLPVLAADSTTAITATPEELNILDGVTSTAAELNILDGVTSTAAELNILDGVTATAAELNYVDGVTSAIQTQLDGKYATSGGELTGSVTITTGFPDLALKSNGERRLLFQDAGGGVDAGLKYASSALQFVYGGVASGDIEMKIEDAKVTITNELALPATVSAAAATDITIVDNTADAFEIKEGSNQYVAITSTDSAEKIEVFKNLHLAGERLFFDTGTQLIRLSDNKTSALKIENHDGSHQDFLDFKTANSGPELIFGAPNQFNNSITVGADDTGYDVTFYGATASAYMQWDESADALVLAGSATLDVAGDIDVDGTANLDVLDVDGTANFASTTEHNGDVTMKANLLFTGSGREIRFKNNTYNALRFQKEDGTTYMGFDTQGDATIFFSQPLDINTTVQVDGTFTVGVDDTGYDVKFFGATASAYMLWDESADDLILAGAAGLVVPEGQLTLGSTAVTSTAAELNILDGVTATAAELNYVDGVTSNIQTQLDALQASDAELTELATMASTAAAAIADLTATEIQILDGATVTTAELNILDGVTSTTAELNILDGVTSTAAELNILDGVTSTAAELNLLDGVTATTAELNYVDGVTSNIQTQLNAKLDSSGAKAALDVDHLITLSGVSAAADDLGTFTGSTISDNGTVKAGMQELETAVETKVATNNGNHTGTTTIAEIDLSGDIDVDGTANLDAVDIDGDVDIAGSINISAAQTLSVVDNQANALAIMEGSNNYINIRTSDSSERVEFNKAVKFASTLDIDGNLDIDADIDLAGDLTFSAVKDIKIVDNDASALEIKEGNNAYLTFNTTNGAEWIQVSKLLKIDANIGVTNQATDFLMKDNTAAALDITESSNSYLKFDTTNSSELITAGVAFNFAAGLQIGTVAVTASAAELNILDGVTSTAAELNILDGVTATAAELNILDGVTADASDLNQIDGITAGTVAASKAVVVDSNKDVTGFRNVTATGTLTVDSVGVSAIQTSGESFADNDTSLMTSAAIDDRIAAAAATESSGTATLTFNGFSTNPDPKLTVTAYYVKVGKMVTVTFSTSQNYSGYAGTATITGLPFAANSNADFYGTAHHDGSLNTSLNDGIVARIRGAANTTIDFLGQESNLQVAWSGTNATKVLNVTITYFTA